MPTAIELLNQICENCREDYAAQFNADPRPAEEIIAGPRYVKTCCYVRDSIRFLEGGQLIFVPDKKKEGRENGYCRNYYVVCRKLTIVGGKSVTDRNPCSPDEPGNNYAGNNVITWEGRLQAAAAGGSKPQAGAGTDNSNETGDPDGPNGGNGTPGEAGNTGGNGQSAPGSLTIIALEIEVVGVGAHLTIDWDGETGGKGGDGQRGGDGGDGGRGAAGQTESSWGSESCSRRPGNGGRGGDGGTGGAGGDGGKGGNAGPIYVISTPDLISGTGAFVGGSISYVNDGGSGGNGGMPANGGARGQGGPGGDRNSPCDRGEAGDAGNPGAASSSFGNPGTAGAPAPIDFKRIEPHPCSDPIPLPIVVSAVTPSHLCRGFASPDDTDVTVTGHHLAQVTAVTSSLAGVSATIKATSTDDQLDLRFDVAGNSATGAGDLAFQRVFGPALTQPGAITVQRFEVLGVAPATGARNNAVAVTITGQCFDPAAAAQNVNVSGTGVNVINLAVLNETTLQCVFDIGATAQQTARNVTVSIGGKSHTLVNGFTVTA